MRGVLCACRESVENPTKETQYFHNANDVLRDIKRGEIKEACILWVKRYLYRRMASYNTDRDIFYPGLAAAAIVRIRLRKTSIFEFLKSERDSP